MHVIIRIFFCQTLLSMKKVYCSINMEDDIYPESILNDHEIVFPVLHFTNHERFKRYINKENENYKQENMNVKFNALGRIFNLDLKLNKRLLGPNFHIETLDHNGNLIQKHNLKNCFYSGHLKNESKSLVSISNCNGLKGVIQTRDHKYYIQPFQKPQLDEGGNKIKQAHVVKRMTDLGGNGMLEFLNLGREKRELSDIEDKSCGVDDTSPHIIWKRGLQSEKIGEQTIETMLTLDRKVAQFYGVDAAKEYALSVANVAHNILRDSTIGSNTINLVVNKLVILTSPLPDLVINHHARNTLASFGEWADRRNEIDDNHYDYAVLLTKHDICADKDQPCETKGLTYIGGMCDHDRSAAIVEAEGFNTAFFLAHQIGHSLGMDHDGVGNACEGSQKVMTPNGGQAADAYHWSRCSADYLQQFLRKEQSKCLINLPAKKRENIETYANVGNVYDVNSQCRFALGEGAKACYQADKDEICSELMCFHPEFHNCTRMKKPSMDGTTCGNDLWCKQGVCVVRGLRDDLVIDGGWSEWNDHPHCTRSCGGGVTYRERACTSPSPNHGGKYCEGDARQYSICNKQPCHTTTPTYRQLQCDRQSQSFYEDKILKWKSPTTKERDSSCNLHCQSVGDGNITKMFGHVDDGTECMVSNIVGRCVQGECHPIGCDTSLGSLLVKDHCGVCGGNGTTCKYELKNNSFAVARSEINNDMLQRLASLEEQKNVQVENIAKRLIQLRAIMKDVISKKCGGDQLCIENDAGGTNVTKKDNIETPSRRFYWGKLSTGCSVSCGSGMEKLQGECRRIDDGTAVADRFCYDAEKPNAIVKACQRSPCPPRWTASKWSSCTRSCGSGRKMRNVYCSLNDGNEEYILPMSQCKEDEKPLQLMICNHESCPVEWYTEPFGECSTTCGKGQRKRAVVCRQLDHTDGIMKNLNDSSCPLHTKPETDIICNAHNPCPGGKCGGKYSTKSGRITSPNFPDNYTNDMECVHEITVQRDKVIRLQFGRFDIGEPRSEITNTQCAGDFLRIVDGKCSEASYKPMQILCGEELPPSYLSTNNNLCLKFVSDQSMVGKGFVLNYTSENIDQKKKLERYPVRDICDLQDEVIRSPMGVVTSPNYPTKYPTNENCKVTFHSNETQGYMLKFDGFQIGQRSGIMDCHSDYLEVTYKDKKERICGDGENLPTISVPANKFSLAFHSSPFSLNKKGFVLTFVTKKYAADYALSNRAALNIQNYTATFQDWQQKLSPSVIAETEDIMEESNADLKKKSWIEKGRDTTKEKTEFAEALLDLAPTDPGKLTSVFYRRRNGIYRPNNNVRKSYIPSTYNTITTYNANNNDRLAPTNYGLPKSNTGTANIRFTDKTMKGLTEPWTDDNLSLFGGSERNYYQNYDKNYHQPTERSSVWQPNKVGKGSKTIMKQTNVHFPVYNPEWLTSTDFFPSDDRTTYHTTPTNHVERTNVFKFQQTYQPQKFKQLQAKNIQKFNLDSNKYLKPKNPQLLPSVAYQTFLPEKSRNFQLENNQQFQTKKFQQFFPEPAQYLQPKSQQLQPDKFQQVQPEKFQQLQPEKFQQLKPENSRPFRAPTFQYHPTFSPNIDESANDWIDGGSITLSKLSSLSKVSPKMFKKNGKRKSFIEAWKEKVGGVSVYHRNSPVVDVLKKKSTQLSIPDSPKSFTQAWKDKVKDINIFETNALIPNEWLSPSVHSTDNIRRSPKSFVQAWKEKVKDVNIFKQPSSTSGKLFPVFTRRNTISKPYVVVLNQKRSHFNDQQNYRESFNSPEATHHDYQEATHNDYWSQQNIPYRQQKRSDYFGYENGYNARPPIPPWQQGGFSPFSNQGFSRSIEITKRQYQSLPFTYFPKFGIFNNHCPSQSSFTCRDVIQHQPCTSNHDCYGNICCETSCATLMNVCVPANMNYLYG